MIKGSTVICYNVAEYSGTMCFKFGETYIIEKEFETSSPYANCISVWYEFEGVPDPGMDKKTTVAFYLDNKIKNFKKFSDHIVTLAGWREMQINSILND